MTDRADSSSIAPSECDEMQGPWCCTLAKGHSGDHIASTGENGSGQICAQWPRAEGPPPPTPSEVPVSPKLGVATAETPTPAEKTAGQKWRIRLVNAIEMFDQLGWEDGKSLSKLLDQCERDRDAVASLQAENERLRTELELRKHAAMMEARAVEQLIADRDRRAAEVEALPKWLAFQTEAQSDDLRTTLWVKRRDVLALLGPIPAPEKP
ncbi:MAG: hypothetical protein ACR652_24510 [Methylocystis sp.]|uniref:hypothetical protein n=1 Tax=Methylocystis sp. TaxID=1911079 RepID=UPI003DA69363